MSLCRSQNILSCLCSLQGSFTGGWPPALASLAATAGGGGEGEWGAADHVKWGACGTVGAGVGSAVGGWLDRKDPKALVAEAVDDILSNLGFRVLAAQALDIPGNLHDVFRLEFKRFNRRVEFAKFGVRELPNLIRNLHQQHRAMR